MNLDCQNQEAKLDTVCEFPDNLKGIIVTVIKHNEFIYICSEIIIVQKKGRGSNSADELPILFSKKGEGQAKTFMGAFSTGTNVNIKKEYDTLIIFSTYPTW